MNYWIKAPQAIQTSVALPSSKSLSNRILLLNALSYSPYEEENLSDCDDTSVMLEALYSNSNTFDIGASGTAMRFLTAFLSKIVGEWTLTGSERMKNRPIGLLVDALNSIGAKIEYIEKEGYPPLRIYGSALRGGEVEIDGNVSSQYISALLMVAPTMEEGLTVRIKGEVISRPYIQMTLDLMKLFGVASEWKDNTIIVPPATYDPKPYTIESDWSAASYWYSLVALAGKAEVLLLGLAENSLQGDAKVAEYFNLLGVETTFTEQGALLNKKERLVDFFEQDLTDCPDLAQTIAVACALLGIPFRLTGLRSLRIKETDRLEALKNELAKLGFVLTTHEDQVLAWQGEKCSPHPTPRISTYDDHRMAMAFTPAALILDQGIRIDNPLVITKSYPTFWDDLTKAGFSILNENI